MPGLHLAWKRDASVMSKIEISVMPLHQHWPLNVHVFHCAQLRLIYSVIQTYHGVLKMFIEKIAEIL